MNLPTIKVWLMLSATVQGSNAILTAEDVIDKEMAWVRKTLKLYQNGFSHNNNNSLRSSNRRNIYDDHSPSPNNPHHELMASTADLTDDRYGFYDDQDDDQEPPRPSMLLLSWKGEIPSLPMTEPEILSLSSNGHPRPEDEKVKDVNNEKMQDVHEYQEDRFERSGDYAPCELFGFEDDENYETNDENSNSGIDNFANSQHQSTSVQNTSEVSQESSAMIRLAAATFESGDSRRKMNETASTNNHEVLSFYSSFPLGRFITRRFQVFTTKSASQFNDESKNEAIIEGISAGHENTLIIENEIVQKEATPPSTPNDDLPEVDDLNEEDENVPHLYLVLQMPVRYRDHYINRYFNLLREQQRRQLNDNNNHYRELIQGDVKRQFLYAEAAYFIEQQLHQQSSQGPDHETDFNTSSENVAPFEGPTKDYEGYKTTVDDDRNIYHRRGGRRQRGRLITVRVAADS